MLFVGPVCRNCSASFWISSMGNCSMRSCRFGASTGANEFRCLLCRHLGLELPVTYSLTLGMFDFGIYSVLLMFIIFLCVFCISIHLPNKFLFLILSICFLLLSSGRAEKNELEISVRTLLINRLPSFPACNCGLHEKFLIL